MIGLIVYHKNIYQLYRPEWIAKFVDSIRSQTKNDFVVYELNYGGGEERIFNDSMYESLALPTFVHAMNHILDKAYAAGCLAVFNTNIDDYYAPNWVERQCKCIGVGYDIVSSNFTLIDEVGEEWHKHSNFHDLIIERELNKGHNIISHPSVAYSRKFLKENRYDPSLIPYEDLELWKKTVRNYKFVVLPDNLLFHRIHSNSVCQSNNR